MAAGIGRIREAASRRSNVLETAGEDEIAARRLQTDGVNVDVPERHRSNLHTLGGEPKFLGL